ncbi:hypothetical protein DKM19_48395 [Streptosporangium sp. 'caverna']|nr:hypothetical protein DKM19_48395 [Streptosporangium sp. 'caverna']
MDALRFSPWTWACSAISKGTGEGTRCPWSSRMEAIPPRSQVSPAMVEQTRDGLVDVELAHAWTVTPGPARAKGTMACLHAGDLIWPTWQNVHITMFRSGSTVL